MGRQRVSNIVRICAKYRAALHAAEFFVSLLLRHPWLLTMRILKWPLDDFPAVTG